ncbi:MAG: RICIN domain-containing protein [Bacteroidota bacterium]
MDYHIRKFPNIHVLFISAIFLFLPSMLFAQKEISRKIEEARKQKFEFKEFNLFLNCTDQKAQEFVHKKAPKLQKYTLLEPEQAIINYLDNNRPHTFSFSLPNISEGGKLMVDLINYDYFMKGFQLIEMPVGKPIEMNKLGLFYYGIIRGDENSLVSINIVDGEVGGFISIERLENNLDLFKLENFTSYLLYNDKENFESSQYQCTTHTEDIPLPTDPLSIKTKSLRSLCFGVYLDISESVYQAIGGMQNTFKWTQFLFGRTATIYANESINLVIPEMKIWTQTESFRQSLDKYAKYRRNHPLSLSSNAHYIHWYDDRGEAWINTLCDDRGNNARGYGMSGMQSNWVSNRPSTVQTFTFAHELGHTFGSRHTHDCIWNGNNTAIDGCGYRLAGDGCNGPEPSDGGTIMSWCHKRPVGINLAKGFHPQPANVIRQVAGQASGSCGGYTCNARIPNGVYKVANVHSGKVVDVSHISQSNGANIHQFQFLNGVNQKWRVINWGASKFTFQALHSNKCMDVAGWSTAEGANVHQWDCHFGNNQLWYIDYLNRNLDDLGSGIFRISSVHSRKALEVYGWQTHNWANIRQARWDKGNNQRWRFDYLHNSTDDFIIGIPAFMSVYPNPVSNQLKVEGLLEGEKFSIFRIDGQAILENETKGRVDVSSYPSGIYLLKVAGKKPVKFIKR